MPIFNFEALDEEGRPQKGQVEAYTADEALVLIKGKGHFPTSVREARHRKKRQYSVSEKTQPKTSPKFKITPTIEDGLDQLTANISLGFILLFLFVGLVIFVCSVHSPVGMLFSSIFALMAILPWYFYNAAVKRRDTRQGKDFDNLEREDLQKSIAESVSKIAGVNIQSEGRELLQNLKTIESEARILLGKTAALSRKG